MSKPLSGIKSTILIFLVTCCLVLLLSSISKAQNSYANNKVVNLPQILGTTQTIQGRTLTMPNFDNKEFRLLGKYQNNFTFQIVKMPQFKEKLKRANFTNLNVRINDIGRIERNLKSPNFLSTFLAIADNYWSREYIDFNLPSSEYVSGRVTCSGQNIPVAPSSGLVSYLELTDINGKNGYYYGKRWISKEQLVDGGCGILKAVNGGKEPTGRLVWGTDTFKIVLDHVDQQRQIASFKAYLRVCASLLTGVKTCTPYFIPLPWFEVVNNNWVAIGGRL